MDLVDLVDSKRFKLCIDVGHVAVYSEESAVSWIEKLGERITHFHFSDYITINIH